MVVIQIFIIKLPYLPPLSNKLSLQRRFVLAGKGMSLISNSTLPESIENLMKTNT